MIAIDVTMINANGDPVFSDDLVPIITDNCAQLIEFFNSCVTDNLVLNTVIDGSSVYDQPYTNRYYAVDTIKATEFQERLMSITAPFSIKQFWIANGFDIESVIQRQIVFEDEPANQLEDLVDVNDNLLWGYVY